MDNLVAFLRTLLALPHRKASGGKLPSRRTDEDSTPVLLSPGRGITDLDETNVRHP